MCIHSGDDLVSRDNVEPGVWPRRDTADNIVALLCLEALMTTVNQDLSLAENLKEYSSVFPSNVFCPDGRVPPTGPLFLMASVKVPMLTLLNSNLQYDVHNITQYNNDRPLSPAVLSFSGT